MSSLLCTTVRQYTKNDSFRTVPLDSVKEFHVVLSFARDYDTNDDHTNGTFEPYWDTSVVTPRVIQRYQQKYGNKVKILVGIGSREDIYPFRVNDRNEWISNATTSLRGIIDKYGLDGIDVYYECISYDTEAEDFVECIGQVIDNLKTDQTIAVASIATTNALNDACYYPLYQRFGCCIDWVVYQIYHDNLPDPRAVAERLISLSNAYKKGNLLSGGSYDPHDWANVRVLDYIEATEKLITFPLFIVAGVSIWAGSADATVAADAAVAAATPPIRRGGTRLTTAAEATVAAATPPIRRGGTRLTTP